MADAEWRREREPMHGSPMEHDTRVVTLVHVVLDVFASFERGTEGVRTKDDLASRLERAIAEAPSRRGPTSPSSTGTTREALTPRELEVLAALGRGLTYEETARALGISANTVRAHVRASYEKTGVASKAEAVAWAMRRGLLT